MKRKLWAAWLLTALLLPWGALAQETFDGTVVAGETVAITAPFGGTVTALDIREGQLLEAGDAVVTLSTTKVWATQDGTVNGGFAQEGDSAEGTVLYLSPVSRYTISCTLSKAHEDVDTYYVELGEKVYIQCVKDGSHRAEGIVTGVSGSSYTVTTTAGEMYLQESAYIYRSPDYDADSCLGTGVVQRTAEVAVSGTGSILKMYVSDGDTVERGQLLFETVSGSLMGLSATGSPEVTADSAGVVTQVQCSLGQQVQQGATLAVLAPRSGYQVAFTIPEDLLSQVAVGDTVEIYFNWNEDKSQPATGQVTAISYVSDAQTQGSVSTEAMYTAYATFTPGDDVRLGMTVTVVPLSDET